MIATGIKRLPMDVSISTSRVVKTEAVATPVVAKKAVIDMTKNKKKRGKSATQCPKKAMAKAYASLGRFYDLKYKVMKRDLDEDDELEDLVSESECEDEDDSDD